MPRGYTRYGSAGGTLYRRTIRASRWDPACGVLWPGTWQADIERLDHGWRYVVVGYYGHDEHVIARGETATLREAMEVADAALASGRAALAFVTDETAATR